MSYGNIKCAKCGGDIEIDYEAMPDIALLFTMEEKVNDVSCEHCGYEMGFYYSVTIDITEGVDVPCWNGESHDWKLSQQDYPKFTVYFKDCRVCEEHESNYVEKDAKNAKS